MATPKKEQESKAYYLISANGSLKTSPYTRYFPFSENTPGYSAQERSRTAESESLDVQFVNGVAEVSDELLIEILDNHHTGCIIKTPGKYKGNILRASDRMMCTITDTDPIRLGKEIADEIARNNGLPLSAAMAPIEVMVNRIPRIMIDAVDVGVLIDVLKKEKGIDVDLPIEKSAIIEILERENLISD